MLFNKDITKQRKITTSHSELKQVLKIVEDLADYIALGVTSEIEKRQWSGY
jgi:predicted nucleic acid-binding OB-fold protein